MEAAFAPPDMRSVMPVSFVQSHTQVLYLETLSYRYSCTYYASVPLTGVASFCAMACCDVRTEETCYDYDDDGNFKTQYCAPVSSYFKPHQRHISLRPNNSVSY